MICSAFDCDNPIHAGGYCKLHYQRLNEYGRLHKVVTGERTKHSLFGMWNKRKQIKNAFIEEWKDFDVFIKDVGEKPSNTFLATIDKTKPCGPDNFEWRQIKLKQQDAETLKEFRARRAKLNRFENPDLSRASNYKYNYGITLEQYEEMLKAQNSVCFICEKEETATYKNTGRLKNLAIDHCHKTGKIRKLLCSNCNLIIGKLEDKFYLIDKMRAYLNG